ncbi:MAG: DNA-formamidopyrimidine glycosylase family protein [Woeseiaceae bacterium]|nr:DNA-formamidopyrimidine glycosylase family protein [Woeseiaceae bacterium]
MPELPDVDAYIEALQLRLEGRTLETIVLRSPFFLRTAEPPLRVAFGRRVTGFERLGKRIAIGLDGDFWLVMHLMIAGRFRWQAADERESRARTRPGRNLLATLHFDAGTLTVTEAGTKKRASLHVVRGREALAAHDPGGLEVLETDLEAFAAALKRENRTLKRALTDPRILSGIGNAFSDEILHAARLSPVILTSRLDEAQIERLFEATRGTLRWWRDRLVGEARETFPAKVTAFRPEMAVHGRYGKPCPVCTKSVQRIRYADNETNYCPTCQTSGKLLADRSLSRLLRKDWPKSVDELEKIGGP